MKIFILKNKYANFCIISLLLTVVALILYYSVLFISVGLALRGYIWDETSFTQNYSEHSFQMIKIGDSCAKVNSLIGKPMIKGKEESREYWYYSWKGAYGWKKRGIVVENGKVIQIIAKWEPG